jgi:hypothetical protein
MHSGFGARLGSGSNIKWNTIPVPYSRKFKTFWETMQYCLDPVPDLYLEPKPEMELEPKLYKARKGTSINRYCSQTLFGIRIRRYKMDMSSDPQLCFLLSVTVSVDINF